MCFGELSGYFQRTTLVAVPTMLCTQMHAALLLYVTCVKLYSRFAILFGILTAHRKHTLFACDLVCTKMSVAMAMGYKIIVTSSPMLIIQKNQDNSHLIDKLVEKSSSK